MVKNSVYILAVLLIALSCNTIKLPTTARVNGDFVRMRAEAAGDAKLIGSLYRNQMVTVVARNPGKVTIGDNRDYWYRVYSDTLQGWTFGAFLDFGHSDDTLDTYESDLGMDWFFNRFSYSTWEYPEKINEKSFSLDEYRALITTVMQDSESVEQAGLGLVYAFYKKPNSFNTRNKKPPYPYLRAKLLSPEFMGKLYYYNLVEVCGLMPQRYLDSADFMVQLVKQQPYIMGAVRGKLAGDEAFVKRVLDSLWVASDMDKEKYASSRQDLLYQVSEEMSAALVDYLPSEQQSPRVRLE